MTDWLFWRQRFQGGVTRSLNISYLRSIPIGESDYCLRNPLPGMAPYRRSCRRQILIFFFCFVNGLVCHHFDAFSTGTTVHIVASVVQHGRTMALIQGKMMSLDGQTVYATCEHHKVNTAAPRSNLGMRDELREQRQTRGGREWFDGTAKRNRPQCKL